MKVRKIAVKRLIRDEKGQALLATLLLLLIGMLIVTPVLNFMGTGVKSGRVYEQKIDEIYAADAGVEDAMWHIRYDSVADLLKDKDYVEYDYSTSYDYPYDLSVNGKNVTVTIQNVWVPKDIPEGELFPDAEEASRIIDDEKLLIIGYPDAAASTYAIKIVYYWQGLSALNVKTLGVWLASGFEYDYDSCSLKGQSFYSAPVVSLDKGGCAVVWNFASPPLLSSLGTGTSGNPLVRTFTFKYKGPEGQIPELVASWIDTTGVPNTNPPYSYSWDDSIHLYKIVSEAGDIQIDAYGAKTKFRRLKSTVSGDYYGTGNSLITGMEDPYNNVHYLLHRSTQATVATDDNDDTLGIPSDATVEAAYLYWTGWIDWNTYNPPDSGNQIRYPSGDISYSGTWTPSSNRYQQVDEQGAHDGDSTYLLLSSSGGGNALFSFPAFNVNVPSGEAIRGLTVSLVARDNSSGYSNNMRPRIRVDGVNHNADTSTEVPTGYGTISYTWTTNPETGNAWTKDQINGVGSDALQGFGVYSTDANPQIRLTQVYAQVYWGSTLRYPAGALPEDLQILVEDTARVNKVYFKGGSSADTLVTTHDWQTLSPAMLSGIGAEGTWYYTCKADVTDLMKGWIDDETIGSNGAGTYTVGHVAATNEIDPSYSFSFETGGGSTGYPLGTPAPEQSSPPNGTTSRMLAGRC